MALLLAVYGIFLAVLYASGTNAIVLVVIASAIVVGQYFFSDKLVLLSTGARIVSPEQEPELHDIIERLSVMADLPKPKIAIINSQVPNAFATGRNEKQAVVAVTTGLMGQLDRPELEAVLAHELSHVKNHDMMVLTIASFLSTVAFFVVRFSLYFGGGLGGRRSRDGGNYGMIAWVVAIAVWFVSSLLIKALSRYREYAADRGSAIITGQPSQLASALLKISGRMQRIPEQDLRQVQGANAFFIIPAARGSSFMEIFSTHPSLEKRLARLQKFAQQIEES
jgi:heat shock protein HtpX